MGPFTKKDFPTSFDKHIAGRHTGEDAEAKEVQKKKKGRNKISPRLQLDWESTLLKTIVCPGCGDVALACMGEPIPFMGHTPSHWPHSEIGPRTPPGTPPANKRFFITKSGVAGFSNGAVFHPLQATVAS